MPTPTPPDTEISRRLPPLMMLRAFEAAGRTGSMRRAAEDIGVSHTVVSRHVKNLEHWLGCKLVRTGPRGLDLTSEGENLLASVSRAFSIIAHASDEVRPSRMRGRLSIICIAGLATRWLTPRLSALEVVLDGAEIELRATHDRTDIDQSGADIYIGYSASERLPPGARAIVRPRMFPVVRPDWLARHGSPATVAEIARLPLLHEGNQLQWANWFAAQNIKPDRPLVGPRLSDAGLSFDAALAGQGIALVNEFMAAEDLRAGRVVEILNSDVRLGVYYIIEAQSSRRNPAVGVFSAWLDDSIGTGSQPAPMPVPHTGSQF